MTRAALFLIALVVALAGLPGAAAAQFFRWTDERGVNHYAEGIDSVPERYRATAVPLGLRNQPAPEPDKAGEKAVASGSTTIRYTPGQPIMVDVRINGSSTAKLMLDTGADRTLISPRALVASGVSITRVVARGQMAGVTGTDQVQYVIVESLEIGEAKVGRMPVAAYEMPQGPGDGLLGRDFLDQFNVSIDSARGEVRLTPK
ncbi:MAG: clan AA aspartic protease [Candidatus Rokubacteria bacterium]|nr:clan AA aspartic protease [Candidatus Rokubacteria bacterium]